MAPEDALAVSYAIPLQSFCQNLRGARMLVGSYFDNRMLEKSTPSELRAAVTSAHKYLVAHMETLHAFRLQDSRYGLALRSQILRVVSKIPASQRDSRWCIWSLSECDHSRNTLILDESLCIPGDPDYSKNGEHSVPEYDLWPYRVEDIVALPVRHSAMPSPTKKTQPADASLATSKTPRPQMITKPQPPRQLSFANYWPTKKMDKASKPTPKPASMLASSTAPFTRKRARDERERDSSPILNTPQKEQASTFRHVGPQKPATPSKKSVGTAKKPVMQAPPIAALEDEDMGGDAAGEEEQVVEELVEEEDDPSPPPVKHIQRQLPDVVPPPRVYHPLTGEPLNSLSFISLPTALRTPILLNASKKLSETAKDKQKATAPPSPSPVPQPKKRGRGHPLGSKNKKGRGASSTPKSSRDHLNASVVTGNARAKASSVALSYEAPSPAMQDEIPEEEMEPAPAYEEEATVPMETPVPETEGDVVHARRFTGAETEPIASGSGAQEEELSLSVCSITVDNTVYACAFHPSVDLQFHEPLSRQALECLKLSVLPPAPESLSKPTTETNTRGSCVFRAHSDLDPHFLRAPDIFWPCFNCSFSGVPELCEFVGEVGEEACTRCKSSRHGKCSTRLNATDFHRVATLLDPLILSGDPAIRERLDRVTILDAEISTFYNLAHSRMAEHNKVVQELVDGLDAIASREGGTAIIDGYTEVSDLIRSFIVDVGKDASESGSEGDNKEV
ncbi:uncharacterized protein EV420DRAFT_1653528 [Desarmillaria tabescens]|uniref:Uncharacterized protein n=1 Tax=Armillaria tabescens TaxID=1929756 RepID=A0AA39J2P8_ARMTA|nr:uncharacterized protein EV420DRAFT_1653528 [Desarmillaria tabescens]KAK0434993.1 hypothetical protein EV420DRAFT_1653528 [Desarmillaria tabescens]